LIFNRRIANAVRLQPVPTLDPRGIPKLVIERQTRAYVDTHPAPCCSEVVTGSLTLTLTRLSDRGLTPLTGGDV